MCQNLSGGEKYVFTHPSLKIAYVTEVYSCTSASINMKDVFACRYSRHDKRSKLPGWILSHLRDAHLNLSTDMALHIAREVCY